MNWVCKITIDGDTGKEVIYECAISHAKILAKLFKHIHKDWLECHVYQDTDNAKQ